jgi:hypothetical protein
VSKPPRAIPGAFAVESASSGPSLLELAQSMTDGVLARGGGMFGGVSVDHQGLGGILAPDILFEVRKGRVTRRFVGMHLEFSTKKIFKDLMAVGGTSSVETYVMETYRGTPLTGITQAVSAPAAQLRDVNLVTSALQPI